MSSKRYLSANELLEDAYALGTEIYQDLFTPDLVIGIARGGEPIAIAIHELLCFTGSNPAYCVIRASSYTGIDQQNEVHFDISDDVLALLGDSHSVLLVDDVFDTGKTLSAIMKNIRQKHPDTDLRCAAVWHKPSRSETQLEPDYSLHETDDWLVFPHELCGLDIEDLVANKPGLTRKILESIKLKKS